MTHGTEPFIRHILSNPDDGFPYLVFSDYLEEQGRDREAAALRALVHHGGHLGVHNGHNGYRWTTGGSHASGDPDMTISPSGITLRHPEMGMVYMLPHHYIESDLLRQYKKLLGRNQPKSREEHNDPRNFDEKFSLLSQLAFLRRTFSERGSDRHRSGLQLQALLKRGATARFVMPEHGADYGEEFTVKVPGVRGKTPLRSVWYLLRHDEREGIMEKLRTHPESPTDDPGHWTHYRREQRGNGFGAAIETYLSSGHLFNEEHRFTKILHDAGLPNVEYRGPMTPHGSVNVESPEHNLLIERKPKGSTLRL